MGALARRSSARSSHPAVSELARLVCARRGLDEMDGSDAGRRSLAGCHGWYRLCSGWRRPRKTALRRTGGPAHGCGSVHFILALVAQPPGRGLHPGCAGWIARQLVPVDSRRGSQAMAGCYCRRSFGSCCARIPRGGLHSGLGHSRDGDRRGVVAGRDVPANRACPSGCVGDLYSIRSVLARGSDALWEGARGRLHGSHCRASGSHARPVQPDGSGVLGMDAVAGLSSWCRSLLAIGNPRDATWGPHPGEIGSHPRSASSCPDPLVGARRCS